VGRGLAVQALALFVLAGCGGGAGEGDPEETRSTTGAAVSQATKKLPWPPPKADGLLGKWDQEGQRVIAWFKADGTFAFGNVDNPYVVGTYEFHGSAITFTSDPGGECKGASWVWEVGLDSSALEDRLRVLFTKGGCGVGAGTQWTFARIG
jgi:hypothetical protein